MCIFLTFVIHHRPRFLWETYTFAFQWKIGFSCISLIQRYHRAVTFLYTLYESGRFSALELVAENWAFASSSAQCCEEQAGANGFASGLTFMGLFPSFIFNISNTGFLWRTTKTFNTSYSLFFPRDAVLLISENVVWSHFIHYLPRIFISLKLVTQQLILFKIIYITFEICKHCICNI